MAETGKKQVFFLDGEPAVHRTAEKIFAKLADDVEIICFHHGKKCLDQMRRAQCHVLVTELKLQDMNGSKLLETARQLVPFLPVVAITGRGNITSAVAAMKAGASDVVEKPLDNEKFLAAIEEALKEADRADKTRTEALTKAEKKVLFLILQGKSNKQMAHLLHRSVRTIEDHRSKIMHKLGVDNLVDLTKLAAKMGLLKIP